MEQESKEIIKKVNNRERNYIIRPRVKERARKKKGRKEMSKTKHTYARICLLGNTSTRSLQKQNNRI